MKRKYIWIAVALFVTVIIFNASLFYYFQCRTEYIESKNYLGQVQSISKQNLAIEQKILKQLPDDNEQAIKRIDEIIVLYNNKWLTDRDKKLQGLGYNDSYSLESYYNVKSVISERMRYDSMRQSIENTAMALSTIDLFNEPGYAEDLALTVKEFYGLNNLSIPMVLDNGINVWINYRLADVLLVLLAVASAVVFLIIYKSELERRLKPVSYILISGGIALAVAVALLYISNLILILKFVENYDLNILIQSLAVFHLCPKTMHLWNYILLVLVIKCILAIIIYMLVLSIMFSRGKKRAFAVTGTVIFMTAEAVFSIIEGNSSILTFLREANIYSAFTFERFFISHFNLNIMGNAVSRINVFYIVLGSDVIVAALISRRFIMGFTAKKLETVQYQYYEDINQKYLETRQMWHDFHNHLITIQDLMRKGELDEANLYLNELENEIDQTHILTKSGSGALDVLIHRKSELAQKNSINLEIHINTSVNNEEFQDVAVCCVVGNLLDNCIEALRKEQVEDKRAVLEISRKGDMLYISTENHFIGEIESEAGKIKTTKADAKSHGIGLQSVKRVCERYGGTVNVSAENGLFKIQALMMAQKEK